MLFKIPPKREGSFSYLPVYYPSPVPVPDPDHPEVEAQVGGELEQQVNAEARATPVGLNKKYAG